VTIVCPYCEYRLSLKGGRPGRFSPRCRGCEQAFLLVIPDASGGVLQVRPLISGATTRAAAGVGSGSVVLETRTPVASPDDAASGSHVFASARAVGPSDPTPPPPAHADALPAAGIRGYEVERELGRGGMGRVYLARQLSLDRHVALKVMGRRWAADPVFVARFTREAYAAAQLSHPNIVHIHDIGEADGTRFFSMEYVRGRSLAELVKGHGKLDPETAVGYVLQAARGLKHAHDRGMIHRDVKPDNLLLDDAGMVKVADLGLVKEVRNAECGMRNESDGPGPAHDLSSIPHSELRDPHLTGTRIALGTPAYMSPEQCRDAARVDHRADVYSLGCTLYVLVTGRPPFDGTTAVQLMTKHAYDPLVPPEVIAGRVPKELSAVIQRMMAKNPDDRFQTMGEVVRTLEAWLGVRHTGTFSPPEEQIARLEACVHEYNAAPAAVLRGRVLTGFSGALALTAVLVTFFGNLAWAFGLAGLAVQAAAAYFVLDGVARRGHLFRRTRQFAWGLTWGDWVVGAAALGLSAVVLALLKVLWIWAGFGLIGVGLAFALRYGLDRAAEAQRRPALDAAGRLLRRLRAQGRDEEEIRQFVAKYAGRDWEAFFEALFGYEAKLAARGVLLRGGSAGVREKHAAWREPILAVMDRVEQARRATRERGLLEAVERANLLAGGANTVVADGSARAAADAMVRAAGRVQEAEAKRDPVNVRKAVVDGEAPAAPAGGPDRAGWLVGLVVGPHVRAVVGAVLLAGCAVWADQNGLVPGAEAVRAVTAGDVGALRRSASAALARPTAPLALAGVPPAATGWADGWNAGFAGLLLFGSLFFRGNAMAGFVLLGAGVAAVGHQYGIRTVEPFRGEHVALMLGAVLALVGYRAGR
jgi:serine/threonine protein kinase